MKSASNFNHFYSTSRLLLGSIIVLLSGCILLVSFGALSKTYAARIGSPRVAPISCSAPSSKNDHATNRRPAGRLDKEGNRPNSVSFLPLHSRSDHATWPAGIGNWSSLGPPGGDVFDAAVSTADPSIALAGIAPDGSFGGTLYRSTDGGNTWSEVLALDGISVFDIEFAFDGTAYIGTQDSVRRSSDGGMSWTLLN